jgi:uncharacterized repeat protein (TIGR01451 family)
MVFQAGQNDVELALNSMVYLGNPNFNGAESISVTISTVVGAIPVTVNAVNDAPVLTVPGAQTGYSNADIIVSGVSVDDVDIAVAGGDLRITLSVTHGGITLGSVAGLTFSAGDGTLDSTVTFSGTMAAVNNALNNLVYHSNVGYYGAETLQISVSDLGNTGTGGSLSDSKTVGITVQRLNVPPVLTVPGAQTGAENAPLSISGTSVSDADAGTGAVKVTLSAGYGTLTLASTAGLTFLAGSNGSSLMTFSGTLAQLNAALTSFSYQGNPGFNGNDVITLTADDQGNTGDDGAKTDTKTIAVTINGNNDAPAISVPGAQTTQEDAPLVISGISLSDADLGGNSILVQLTVTNGTLSLSGVSGLSFTAGDGTADTTMTFTGSAVSVNSALSGLTYQPPANLSVLDSLAIHVDDQGFSGVGGAKTADAAIAITVVSRNDAPSFTKGEDKTVLEDSGAASFGGWASAVSAGPANESGQTLTFEVTNTNNMLFSVQPAVAADGTLTFTPAANANGTAVVTVVLKDDGGTLNGGNDTSAAQTFNISVTSVNDVPSFVKGADVNLGEDVGAQSISGWATSISPGPEDESGQTVAFLVSNDNNVLFSVQPSIAPNGTLSFTPTVGAFGTANVTVQVQDNAGTANGGVDTSAAQTFSITLSSVNDPPVISVPAAPTTLEDTALTISGISIADPDLGGNDLLVELSVSKGTISLNGVTGLTFTTGDGTADSLMKFTGSAANVNTALNGFGYQPASDESGAVTLSIHADDKGFSGSGGAKTADASLGITVTPVNDVPSFTAGEDKTLDEGSPAQSFSGWATLMSPGPVDELGQTIDFLVSNTNTALFSVQPAVAPNGTLTFTPAPDAFGTAVVSVRIHDNGGTANGGVDTSAAQTFSITLSGINDAPSFVKGADVNVPQDSGALTLSNWATSISAGPYETSQTVTFAIVGNTNSALFTVQPAVSAGGNLTFTLAAGQSGATTVTLRLQDDGGTANGGADTSADQSFVITVVPPTNRNPVGNTDSYVANEDETLTVSAGSGVLANDTDEDGNTLAAVLVSGPANGVLSLSSNGSFNYTPNADYFGPDSFSYQANDGLLLSGVTTVNVTVNSRNDAPSFTKGADQSMNEDAPAQSIVGWATLMSCGPANELGQALSFIVSNSNNSLFSVQPAVDSSGNLTFTPAANAFGSAIVTVQLKDDGGTANGGTDTSAAQTFSITIAAVNDVPVFAKGADQTVLEDSGAKSVSGWATGISAGPNEAAQTLTFQVSNSNNALFAVQPAVAADGTLTFTPAANANGTAVVTVILKDDGGTANGGIEASAAQSFSITVTGVNDVPSFTKGVDQILNEGSPAQSIAGWATGISPGTNETGQSVSFLVTNDNTALFAVQPAVAADGTLTFTPAADAFGTAVVTIRIKDDGGTADGGIDTSAAQTFNITLTGVNDAPSFAKGADQTVFEDSGVKTVSAWATSISAGAANESGQVLTFQVTNSNTALFAVQPALAADGTLTFTPAANANGSAIVSVVLKDNGGTAGGGVDTSAAQTFTITVSPVNDAPSFSKGPDQTVNEDSPAQNVAGWAAFLSRGPADEAGQSLSFQVTNNNNALFAVQPSVAENGTLSYTPAANAFGVAVVSVVLKDNGGTANGGVDTFAAQTFTITLTAVNDPPSFVKGGNVNIPQDSGAHVIGNWATSISAGPGETSQSVSFFLSNDNNALFAVQPTVSAAGALSFSLAAGTVGTANVTVCAKDNGGTDLGGVDTSGNQTFVITVAPPTNVAPVGVIDSYSVNEDEVLAVSNGSGVLANDTDANGNTLSTSLVSGPANGVLVLYANGSFNYTPNADFFGNDSFVYRASDGLLTSADTSVTITVNPKNDAPSFTKGSDQAVFEDCGPVAVNNWATALSVGPANESGQTLAFTVSTNNPGLFAAQPAIDAAGKLTYTPAADAAGTANVTVQLQDDGGTANGGTDSTGAQTFAIMVSPVNDAPLFTKGADQGVLEDCGAQTVSGWASGIAAGSANETGQTLSFTVSNDTPSLFTVQPAVAPNGTLSFTPAPDKNGTAAVSIFLTDNGGTANGGNDTSAVQTFQIVVTSANDAPSFVKGANQTVVAGTGPQTIAGWASAISPGPYEGDQTVDFIVSNSNNAIFLSQPTVSPTGVLSFTPSVNTPGTAVVTVQIHDDGGILNSGVDTSAPQTFNVTVTPPNGAPVAVADSYSVNEDAVLSVAAGAGVLANDSDPESSPLTATLVSPPSHGTIAFSSDGAFTYTPNAQFFGADSFSYKAGDGFLFSPITTVSLTVTAVNDAPVLSSLSTVNYVPGAAGVKVCPLVTVTDVDDGTLDGATVQITSGLTSGEDLLETPGAGGIGFVWNAGSGMLTLSGTAPISTYQTVLRAITYRNLSATPVSGIRTLTWTVNDGNASFNLSAPKVSTVNIGGANAAPTGTADVYSCLEDQALSVSAPGVLANDSDADGNPISAVLLTGPSSGTLNLNSDGSFLFTPGANFSGTDQFTYAPNDGAVNGAAVTVSITVTDVNDAPFFVKGPDVSVDEDAGPQALTWATSVSPGTPFEASQILDFQVTCSNPALFSVVPTVSADGILSFTPAADAFGSATVTLRLHDSGGTANGGVDLSEIQTFLLQVLPVNDAPKATADGFSVAEGETLTVTAPGLLVNDQDMDGPSALQTRLDKEPSHGSLTLNPDGGFVYKPAVDFFGEDSFFYRATDGVLNSDPATVTILVSSYPFLPLAGEDAYETYQNASLTIAADKGLLINDSDPSGKPLTAILDASPTHGLLLLQGDGSFGYQPAEGWAGVDSFSYRANNGTRSSRSTQVKITSHSAVSLTIVADQNEYPESATSPMVLRIKASAPVPMPLTVYFEASGTADPGKDYSGFPQSIVIAQGKSEAEISAMAMDDQIDEDDEVIEVTIATSAEYRIGAEKSARIVLTDDDSAGFIVEETEGDTRISEEGRRDKIGFALKSRPLDSVTLTPLISNSVPATERMENRIAGMAASAPELIVSPSELVFTPENWNQLQWLDLSVPADQTAQGNRIVQVKTLISSSDVKYQALVPASFSVKVVDRIIGIAGTLIQRERISGAQGGRREIPLSNVSLDLLDSTGAIVATVITRPDGSYDFGMTLASYSISFKDPASGRPVQFSGETSRVYFEKIDPAGIVYDARSGVPVKGAKVEMFQDSNDNGLIDSEDILVYETVTGSGGDYQYWTTVPARLLLRVSVNGFSTPTVFPAPAGRRMNPVPVGDNKLAGQKTGTYFYDFTFAANSGGVFENDIPVSDHETRLSLTKDGNRQYASVGEVITYTLLVQNSGTVDMGNFQVTDTPPKGLRFVKGHALLDGKPVDVSLRSRRLRFSLPGLAAGKNALIRYQMRVGASCGLGKIRNHAYAHLPYGTRISNSTHHSLEIIPDPVFGEGNLIGKVFGDQNGNGEQDLGENGLEHVLLMTADGMMVRSDRNGLFHVPGLVPGRHLLRVMPTSCPEGWEIAPSRETQVFDFTEGMMLKASFGLTPVRSVLPATEKENRERRLSSGKERNLTWVGLLDARAGSFTQNGDRELLSNDDPVSHRLSFAQRTAFFVQGNIRKDWALTASYDSARRSSFLDRRFGRADAREPILHRFMPTFGDASVLDRTGANTQGPLFLKLTHKISSLTIGNFDPGITETELARFQRELYGVHMHGENEQGLAVDFFQAKVQHQSAHNEFFTTGGSLYYLKEGRIVEGSEKVTLELRDPVTNLIISTVVLQPEMDYELDYFSGRIVLLRPVSGNSLTSLPMALSGISSPKSVLIVDYDFESSRTLNDGTHGYRLSLPFGNGSRLGVTSLQQDQAGTAFRAEALDGVFQLAPEAIVSFEKARSRSGSNQSAVSFDGGMTFFELALPERSRGEAWLLRGDFRPHRRTRLNVVHRNMGSGFVSGSSGLGQGQKIRKMEGSYQLDASAELAFAFSEQCLLNQSELLGLHAFGAERSRMASVALRKTASRKRLSVEWRRQEVTGRLEPYIPSLEADGDILAWKGEWKQHNGLSLFVERQDMLSPPSKFSDTFRYSTAIGFGKTTSRESFEYRRVFGPLVDGDEIRFSRRIGHLGEAYQQMTIVPFGNAGPRKTWTTGARVALGKGSDLVSEKRQESSRRESTRSELIGVSRKFSPNWTLQFQHEKGTVQTLDGSRFRRWSLSMASRYSQLDSATQRMRLRVSNRYEIQNDHGTTENRHVLMQNTLEANLGADITLFVRHDVDTARDDTLLASRGSYRELSLGLAYRPIRHNRLGILVRSGNFVRTNIPLVSGLTTTRPDTEKSRFVSFETSYDLTRKTNISQKLAWKWSQETVPGFSETYSSIRLLVTRVTQKISRLWSVGCEYRKLVARDAGDSKWGCAFEFKRKVGRSLEAGIGWNCSQIRDDITQSRGEGKGVFFRITGSFS